MGPPIGLQWVARPMARVWPIMSSKAMLSSSLSSGLHARRRCTRMSVWLWFILSLVMGWFIVEAIAWVTIALILMLLPIFIFLHLHDYVHLFLFFGALLFPSTCPQDMLRRFYGKVVIDLTPGSGVFAATCIAQRIPYVGFCFTEKHKEALTSRLEVLTLKSMCTEGCPIYEGKCASVFSGSPVPPAPKPTKPKGKPAPTPGGNPTPPPPKPKPAQKPKPGKPKGALDDELSDISGNESEGDDW